MVRLHASAERLAFAALLFPCLCLTVRSDEVPDPAALLTVDRIYNSTEFKTKSYSVKWLEDGSGYTKLEKSADPVGGQDIVRYEPATGNKVVLVSAGQLVPDAESAPLKISGYSLSRDLAKVLIFTNTKRVWRHHTRGDFWVLDRAGRELSKLGGDGPPSTLMFSKLSPDGRYAAYVRDGDIFVQNLSSNDIRKVTTKKSPYIINGTSDWVHEEEFGLRDCFRWSPDSSRIAYLQFDTTGVKRFQLVDNSSNLYPSIQDFPYPKAGHDNASCRVGVVHASGGETTWMQTAGHPRQSYIARLDWHGHGQSLVVQRLNRLQNSNRLLECFATSGEVRLIHEDNDDAWLRVNDEMLWIDDHKHVTWPSEVGGWRQIYLWDFAGTRKVCATPGEYDVIRLLHVDEKKNWLYFIASPDNPTQRYLFRCRFDGGGLQRLSPQDQPGTHAYQISKDGRWAIHTYSTFTSPPITDLVELPSHKVARVLEANEAVRKKIDALVKPDASFTRIDIGGGVELDGWVLQPPDLDKTQKYPVVVYVYGEPAGQTAVDRWGGSSLLWHWMLAQRGYVVMNFDNRGTPSPRGREWRKIVYRKVGILAPQDQAAAVNAMLKRHTYLDGSRIGVWGWSGGGSMTLNAMFKYPKLYHTGISIAPVANQRAYDTIYQERYMGLPSDNVDGFLNGSPVNFAKNLEGNLLLIHGTGDDNCHYAATEALINELIRHNKPFSMMSYPNRTHSIKEGKNTTRHLRQLMTQYLETNLPREAR